MLEEPGAIRKDPTGPKRVIFMKNIESHGPAPEVDEALKKLNFSILYLPKSIHLIQPR